MTKDNKCLSNIIIAVVAIAVVVFLAYSIISVSEKGVMEDKCTEIESSADLNFPCSCVPTIRDINESDYVDSKTTNMCTCTCDIGGGETYTVEIRVSE